MENLTIPQLKPENLEVAHKVVELIEKQPGIIKRDVQVFINQNKELLKPYRTVLHYKNYENIFLYLFGNKLIKTVKTSTNVHFFLADHVIPNDLSHGTINI